MRKLCLCFQFKDMLVKTTNKWDSHTSTSPSDIEFHHYLYLLETKGEQDNLQIDLTYDGDADTTVNLHNIWFEGPKCLCPAQTLRLELIWV